MCLFFGHIAEGVIKRFQVWLVHIVFNTLSTLFVDKVCRCPKHFIFLIIGSCQTCSGHHNPLSIDKEATSVCVQLL